MLDPKLLQFFVEVAETASFSQAAARLNVTQSWLSRQVMKLEQQIGFKLFERTSRVVILTRDGEALLPRARQAVDHVEGVQSLAAQMVQKRWSLTMGVPTYALTAESRLALCDQFLQRYRRVEIDTRIDSSRELTACLARGDLDVAFTIAFDPLRQDQQFETLIIASGQLSVVFAEGDMFEEATAITLAQLATRCVAAFAHRSNAELYGLIFQPAIDAGARIIEFSDYSFHRRLGDHSAVTLMPSWQSLPAPNLRRRPLLDAGHAIDLAVIRLRSHALPALNAFWEIARRQAV